jgi:hypothetical protein
LKGFIVDVISDAFVTTLAPDASIQLEGTYWRWLMDWQRESSSDCLQRPMLNHELAMSASIRVMCRGCRPCDDSDQLEMAKPEQLIETFSAHDRACSLAMGGPGTVVLDALFSSTKDRENGQGKDKKTRRRTRLTT